jgi:hypothetical protein
MHYAFLLSYRCSSFMALPSEHPCRIIYPHELQNLKDVDAGFLWDHADSVVLDCMSWSAGVWSCRIGSPLASSVVFFLVPFVLYFDVFCL